MLDFTEAMETLDKINEAYKTVSVSAEEEKIAEKDYRNHIMQGYVDMSEFHKAFDRQIAEQHLEGLFKDDGSLVRYSYGAVKIPKTELEKEIKKLWVYVFSYDHNLIIGKDAYDERQKQIAAEKEKKIKDAEEWEKYRKEQEVKEKANQEERISILNKLGLGEKILEKSFDRYIFKDGGEFKKLNNLKLDSLKMLSDDAKLAAVIYFRHYSGKCYHDNWNYFSWNSELIDGLDYWTLHPGREGMFNSHTTAYNENQISHREEFLTGFGMNSWAEDEDELDSSD